MDALIQLLSQYSLEATLILIVTVLVAIKFGMDLFHYFYNKIEEYFNTKVEEEQKICEILNCAEKLTAQTEILQNAVEELRESNHNIIRRLQENTRAYIIEKHDYFCYQVRGIDARSLDMIELRYLYYTQAGGNSFIGNLMEEIRELPIIPPPSIVINSKDV